ncbi:MAG: MerR family transcriptional regulator, partial [Gemmatimonadaceae bacterium]
MAAHPRFPKSNFDVALAALSAAAEPWVAQLPVPDQRIQSAPDSRTIRFYQTSGLLDRPVRYDGRTAKYGRRHLLQLLAIRALQSKGLSLAQVQSSLAGATDSELQQLVESALSGVDHAARNQPRVVELHSAEPYAPADFIAVELAPGVVVTIDSRIHIDAARTIDALRRALIHAPAHSGD